MKLPIAILFANLKGNIGDFAILHAMLRELKRAFPGQPLHVFRHGFHNVDHKRLAAFAASSDVEFELAGTTHFFKLKLKPLVGLIRLLGLWPIAQAYLVRRLAEHADSDASQFRNYDAVFLAGGDYGGGAKTGISVFGTVKAVCRYNDRIYTFPFSLNPRIRGNNSKRSLQHNFERIMAPRIARDGITKELMDELGIASVLGVDSVFSLQDLAQVIEPMTERNRSSVLIALTGSGARFEFDLAAAVHRLSSFPGGVVLMTTCELEDGQQYRALAQKFGIPYLAPATWQATVAEIKASSLLVTNRLHGLILGTLANAPLLPVADRKKSEAFVKDARIPYSAASLRALTTELLERSLADRDLILARMHEYLAQARRTTWGPLQGAPSGQDGDFPLGMPVERQNSRPVDHL